MNTLVKDISAMQGDRDPKSDSLDMDSADFMCRINDSFANREVGDDHEDDQQLNADNDVPEDNTDGYFLAPSQ